MGDHSTFELVEDEAVTTSGFELRINVARFSSARPNEISITNGCATFGEFHEEAQRLIFELQDLISEAEKRFGSGDFGPTPLALE